MASDSLEGKPITLGVLSGVDESVDSTSPEAVSEVGGVFPFFHFAYQRFFGKKIIDYNPDQQVLAIHQAFNGVCLYGYFVETSSKLYYHVCSAPPDLRIRFATLQS